MNVSILREESGEKMNFLNKLERRFGRLAIPNLMRYLIGAYIVGYVLRIINPSILNWLTLEPYFILHGQIWRLISWVFIPPGTGIIWAVIMMLFYYQLGMNLERTWGTFRFNVYILGGILFTIIGAFVLYFIQGQQVLMGGYFSTYYINMSIFLAFAMCYPDMQVMLYFIIPIKMKWMAYVYLALVIYSMITTDWPGRIAIIMSLLNFVIFFFMTRDYRRISPGEIHRKKVYREQTRTNPSMAKHKCAICGRTEKDDPTLVFRFCSKCDGNYEYCQEHLFTHQHIKR